MPPVKPYPEDTGVLISIKRRFLYCPSTHHTKKAPPQSVGRAAAAAGAAGAGGQSATGSHVVL
eukprot:scaffold46515_cov19-Phaeocystis_antarctica.AAC.1